MICDRSVVAGSCIERQRFLISGTTRPVLYLDGKTPELNDKLANLTISGAKIFDVSFKKETGRVSSGDDLGGSFRMILLTSSTVGLTGAK